ncbi:LuxR C-terminal-related transcriptional regulator [Verrucosispora sp. WMMD573]|uniref:LuxR C-terminal-related transcriptional regulator n=1 Tax=Verrucosispora sp. WMMD573 TaxID=3015149 RepID=UPI00248BB787|nr:LuxR C-terminal-related transcriptional regulator [Verrucosispora sp. WMMD573]WBB51981.1 LuxR C-terminal-related transcriptional regulator [Verrucosispora sp. WMMD573]
MCPTARRSHDSERPGVRSTWTAELAPGPAGRSVREGEILSRHAAGASATEIAADLHLSRGTVRNYLASAVTLEYPRSDLQLSGPGWPWLLTLRPVLLGLSVNCLLWSRLGRNG